MKPSSDAVLALLWTSLLILVLTTAMSASDDADVSFLTASQAKAAIVDESVEPYFSLLQSQEMACKTEQPMPEGSLASQREICRQRYANAVESFSDEEQKAIRSILATVTPHLKAHYPAFAAEPWRFIKIDPRFEGGMPHTRGHCIVLSDGVVLGLVAMASLPVGQNNAEMLVHEQTHVVQRLHPTAFAHLYTDVFGFVRMPQEPARSAGLISHQLVNPDGIACVWAYPVSVGGARQLIEPQVILGSDAVVPRMPNDFALIALPIVSANGVYQEQRGADGEPVQLSLESLSDYVSAFAPCDEYFHPNEISAVLFSRLVIHDVSGMPESQDSPAMHRLRGWASEALARPMTASASGHAGGAPSSK